jgi:hypothetical protein
MGSKFSLWPLPLCFPEPVQHGCYVVAPYGNRPCRVARPCARRLRREAPRSLVSAKIPGSHGAKVDVDGVTGKITGGPFRMPVAVNGISLLAGCTRGWTGGIEPDALTKDVRLEACDASRPWCSGGRLAFPVRNYRREGASLPDRHIAAPDNAWLRSASMSSMCSMPMQSRIVSGVTPAEANSASESCRCVVEAG